MINQYERLDFWADAELCDAWDQINFKWNLAGCFDETLALAIEFCSGLRRAELAGLKVEDCQTVPFPMIYVRNGKGNKSREVELIPEVEAKFRDRIQYLTRAGNVWVFQPWGRKRPMSLRAMTNLWNRAIASVGLRDHWIDETGERRPMGIHAARRTFATYARLLRYTDDEGQRVQISLEALRAQLGHTKIETSMRYYMRSLPGQRWVPRSLEWPKHI